LSLKFHFELHFEMFAPYWDKTKETYLDPPRPVEGSIVHLIAYFWLMTGCSDSVLFLSR